MTTGIVPSDTAAKLLPALSFLIRFAQRTNSRRYLTQVV